MIEMFKVILWAIAICSVFTGVNAMLLTAQSAMQQQVVYLGVGFSALILALCAGALAAITVLEQIRERMPPAAPPASRQDRH